MDQKITTTNTFFNHSLLTTDAKERKCIG